MKNKLISAICAAALLPVIGTSGICAGTAQAVSAAGRGETATPAFVGAEGGGMYATGARAAENIEVYHVTNLSDSGAGSFRDAVSKGGRIVVFDVSGYIDLASNVSISHDNMTILGQTAPGGGICFRSNNIKVSADNVILRYLRFRVGAHDAAGNDTRAQDGLEITDNCERVIIDHCSVSWGTDENLSAYAVKDVTIQNSIIAEALNQSVHDKGEHSYAAIWGGVNLTVHHNLIATHKSRNPKIGTSETVAMTAGYTDGETLVDIHNNIIYNWGDKAGYGSENGAHTYIQNNIYRPGPATPSGKRARIFELSVGQKYEKDMLGSVYAADNFIDVEASDPDYSTARLVNEDNYRNDLHTGVYVDTKYLTADSSRSFMAEPDAAYNEYAAEFPSVIENTDAIYERILDDAGATLPRRDAVDERIINDVRNRTAPSGSNGSAGLLDDPRDAAGDGFDDRGYPMLEEASRGAGYDTDGDGIPDTWESRMGLDPSNPTDGTLIGPDGYTWLEIFVETAITTPAPEGSITIAADEGLYSQNEPVTLTASYTGGAAYDNGIVTVPDGTEGTAIVCGYENGLLKDIKTAVFDGSSITAEVGAIEGEIRSFLWDSLGGMIPIAAGGVSSFDFYCNDTRIGTSADGSLTAVLPTGDNLITAKAYLPGGGYILSPVKHISVNGSLSPDAWTADGAAYDGECYTLPSASRLSKTADGDFKLVTKLDSVTSRHAGVETGLFCGDLKLYKTYNDSFEPIIGCSESDTTLDGGDIRYLEISRSGSTVTVYAAANIAELENTPVDTFTSSGAVEVGAYSSGDALTVSKLSMLQLATTQTAPIAVLGIDNGGRLIMNGDTVEVDITPDGDIPVTEVWLYLGDTPIASQEVYITQTETISLPFAADAAGFNTVTVYCFDAQLGRGADTRSVSVSQDISPWTLTDLGTSDSSYVSVTSDYTYKIGSGTGSTAYVNQLLKGDTRMYYRSRMQNSDKFGVLLKAGDEEIFFGGVKESGAYRYKLIKNGTTVTDVTDTIGASQNQYFIAEKAGNTVNIYRTENGTTVYKTKTLIASTATAIGNEYSMGFVAEGGEPDSGWVSLEGTNNNTSIWNFDNGLDWSWQIQEANVLSPEWTDESVAGNESGKMKIVSDQDYSSERYVLHEYLVPEGNNVITAAADVLLSGEKPGLNVYLNTGASDEAFKISFSDDGYIYIGGEATDTEYDTANWYTVTVTTDQGAGSAAEIIIKDAEGKFVADASEVYPVHFRSQLDTKKAEIRNGIFFEPIASGSGMYYIDNVSVAVDPSKIQKNVTASHFWKFTDDSFDGLTKIDSGTESAVTAADTSSNSKTIDGISFTKRYSLQQNGSTTNRCLKFMIPAGTTDVTIYAASANNTETRTLVVYDGTAHETALTSAGAAVKHHYDSEEPVTIYVYAQKGINLYGISYETYEYVME